MEHISESGILSDDRPNASTDAVLDLLAAALLEHALSPCLAASPERTCPSGGAANLPANQEDEDEES